MDRILVAAGDGIGPEVIEAALHVMDGTGLDFELVIEPVGMAALEERGTTFSDETLELAREVDAILYGAVESPPPGEPYRSPLLTLRRELDLFANVRPARPLLPGLSRLTQADSGLDVVVIRENTEGLYVQRERDVEGGVAAEKIVTSAATERLARFALQWARDHGRRRVTCVHKANVLRRSDGLFLSKFHEVAREVAAGLEVSDMHLDSAAAAMVTSPGSLDVLVTPNLYGDVLSDLAAAICGGLGLAPSGSFGREHALFEPVHGSAPDIAGQGIANPVGAILSAAMMLEYLDHGVEAQRMEAAVLRTLASGVLTPDLGGRHTTLGFAQEARDELERGSGSR